MLKPMPFRLTAGAGGLLAVLILASSSTAAVAQSTAGDLPSVESVAPQGSASAQFNEQMAQIRDFNGILQNRIDKATEQLNYVADMDNASVESEINDLFQALRDEVTEVLRQVSPNSALIDALSRARETTIVFRDDLVRRPEDHPFRQQNIDRLNAAIQEYEVIRGQLASARERALQQLHKIGQQQNAIIEQVRIGETLTALDMARSVVSDLGVLTQLLNDLQQIGTDGTDIDS